jgi:hypothetical protein
LNAEEFTGFKIHALKTAMLDFDIGEVAVVKGTVNKFRFVELTPAEVAFFERTIRKFFSRQILSVASNTSERLALE